MPGEIVKLDPKVKKMLYDFFAVQEKVLWIPEFGLNGMDISFFMNTSSNPNVKSIRRGENFRTMRRIKRGEELTIDYKTFDENQKK